MARPVAYSARRSTQPLGKSQNREKSGRSPLHRAAAYPLQQPRKRPRFSALSNNHYRFVIIGKINLHLFLSLCQLRLTTRATGNQLGEATAARFTDCGPHFINGGTATVSQLPSCEGLRHLPTPEKRNDNVKTTNAVLASNGRRRPRVQCGRAS